MSGGRGERGRNKREINVNGLKFLGRVFKNVLKIRGNSTMSANNYERGGERGGENLR